jgi:hypothetical protein
LTRKYNAVSTQPNLSESTVDILKQIQSEQGNLNQLTIFEACNRDRFEYLEICLVSNQNKENVHSLVHILSDSKFCLIFQPDQTDDFSYTKHLAQLRLFDALAFNCIPVIVGDDWILPFSEFIDWTLISVRIKKSGLRDLFKIINEYDDQSLIQMSNRMRFIYGEYFGSVKKITIGIMDLMQTRIYSSRNSRSYYSWNFGQRENRDPVLIPLKAVKSSGLSAILVGHRDENKMIHLIENVLFNCSSLDSVLVIWLEKMPEKSKLLDVEKFILKKNWKVKIKFLALNYYNHGNIFINHQISTESVLALDENATSLTCADIEKAFEVWLLHSMDRIVLIETREAERKIDMQKIKPFIYNSYYTHAFKQELNRLLTFKNKNSVNFQFDQLRYLIQNLTGKSSLLINSYSSNIRLIN